MDAGVGDADGLCSPMHGGTLGGGDGQEPRACLQGTSLKRELGGGVGWRRVIVCLLVLFHRFLPLICLYS